MQFIDFVKSNNRKILIDNNLSDGNSIIKLFSLSNKISISNYEIFNINLLAKSLLLTNPKYKYINNEQSTYLFYSFLDNKREHKNDLYNLIPDSSFSFESAKICLSTINEIRKGKRKESKNENIDNLINDYEKYLLSNSYYDDVLMLNKCIELMNSSLIKDVLKLKSNFVIGVIDSYLESLTYLERKFLDALVNKLNTSFESLTLFTENTDISINSYKTYGFYQEVENVINIINQNKLSVSDVEIIATDNKYSNTLKAYFDNYKIPYSFSSGDLISCYDIYGLIDSIIDFYNNHYSIKNLFDIYRSNALIDDYKNINILGKLHSNKDDLLLHASSKEFNDKQKAFIVDLLNLKVSNNVYEIYFSLIKLLKTYTKQELLEPLLDTFNNKTKIFELCSSLNIKIELFDLIRRVFENVKIINKITDETPIMIRSLSSVNHFFKKHVFILGLSSSQLKLKEVESPLLSDEDISNIIDTENYYVELPSKRNIRLNNKLDRLTKYNFVSNLYLSYSEYDSDGFKVLSPSTYYNKYLNNESDNTVNPFIKIKYKEVDLDEKLIGDKLFKKLQKNKDYSASGLNNLYKCPLEYLYIQYYVDICLDEYDNSWLFPYEKGNLIHKVLEDYFSIHKDKKFDEASLNDIFSKVVASEKKKHPFDNEEVINQEINDSYKVIKRFLKYNNNDSYQVLGCEIKFKDINIKLDKKSYCFNGKIDRVDYYKVPNSDEIHLRVYDYKSGRNKKDISTDGMTQSFIYPYAIKEILKNDKKYIDILGKFDPNKIKVEFYYVYLYIYDSYSLISEEDINTNIIENAKQLDKFYSLKNSYASFLEIYKPNIITATEQNSGKCGYCLFNSQCAIKKHNTLDSAWKGK